MSRKHKPHKAAPDTPQDIRVRLNRALHENRFQAALELAKDLLKHQPTPEHRQLVLTCYLGRARELRGRNSPRDAVTVLQSGLEFSKSVPEPPPDWLPQVVEEFLLCGAAAQALPLIDRLPEAARPKVINRLADAAIQQEAAGRNLLPELLRADYDRVLKAFGEVAAGQDDAARETLQGVGLRSPFLEWKLFLRGLQAYYLRDDARALENWQRLDPSRLPARLAAPHRAQIDAAFRAAQSPEAQKLLQRQADQLEGYSLAQAVRNLRTLLTQEERLPEAFRAAEAVLPQLRQELPRLEPRLARCFYWAIIAHGQPEDINRYRRVFGTPPDDPQFHKLTALVLENIHELDRAHKEWGKFEQTVAANKAAWPGDHAGRVRALVALHMGQNAAAAADIDRLEKIPGMLDFFGGMPEKPKPLKPSAAECFQKAIDLAPDLLEAHLGLLRYHQEREEDAPAEKAARQLLRQFPDHADGLETLGDILTRKGEHDEAIAVFQRAVQANPLERRPQSKLETAHMYRARAHAEAGRFDEARADYQTALGMARGHRYPALCKWAACEFKAGDAPRAEELLRQALGESGSGLAVTYSMLIETIRLKLPPAMKKRFNDDFNAALAAPVDATAAVELLSMTVSHKLAGVTYRAQKTHEQKVLKYVGKATNAAFTEQQLLSLTRDFLALKSAKMARQFAQVGRRKFPQVPHFPLMEADSYMLAGPGMGPSYQVGQLLDEALKLAERMPRDPKQQELVERIREKQRAVRAFSPFMGMFDGFYDDGHDDDYDDDDDGW